MPMSLLLAVSLAVAAGADPAGAIGRIKAVGPEGKGNAEAAAAWKELADAGPTVLLDILAALDDASPAAANWLRTAADTIAERARAAGRPLPADRLEAFVKDAHHSGAGRRLAYELLCQADRTAPERLLPGMLNDPGRELRRDAVAFALEKQRAVIDGPDKPAAVAALRKLFGAARDEDQVHDLADRLKKLGAEPDLSAHFGFVKSWWVVGPFDNRGGAGLNRVDPPEQGVDLAATYPGKHGTPVGWKPWSSDSPMGIVDLNKGIVTEKGVVAYAFAVIESPEERPVQVRLGTIGANKIFLNGKLLFTRDVYHQGISVDQYVGRGTLRKGRNELLLKICQNEQTDDWAKDWVFQCRLCDDLGGAVPFSVVGRQASVGGQEPPLACLLSSVLCPLSLFSADWPQFRGPDGSAASSETGLPTRWGPAEGLRWKADLPGRAVSCPVVAGGKVFVTASSEPANTRLHLLCFDARGGQKLWHRQFTATGPTLCNPTTSMAAPTPVSGGGRVFALFGSGDLVCCDADGNLLWYRSLCGDYPGVVNQVGMASSLLLVNDTLIVPLETPGDSFLAGLDAGDGRNRWKAPRPREMNYTTPVLLARGGRTELVFASRAGLTAYDPADGSERWRFAHDNLSMIPSPSVADGRFFVSAGDLIAVQPPDDAGPARLLWRSNRLRTGMGSPLVHGGRVYTVTSAGVLVCADAADGKLLWQERLRGGSAAATPVAADGKVYVVGERGVVSVVQTGEKPATLATIDMGEPIYATPAVADGAIFLRAYSRLYCVGAR
jgi:outer membrane protein assembly factor BamB